MKKSTLIRKGILLLTVFTLSCFTFLGCGADDNTNNPNDMAGIEDTDNGNDITNDNIDDTANDTANDNVDDTQTGDDAASDSVASMELVDIINSMYDIKQPGELSIFVEPLDITDADSMAYNTGLVNLDNVKEAAFSETMIGSQAYSLVLVRVNDANAIADTANEMKSNIDQNKWICVEADDMQVVSSGDVILLFMVSSSFADSVTSADMVAAFEAVCNSDVTTY